MISAADELPFVNMLSYIGTGVEESLQAAGISRHNCH